VVGDTVVPASLRGQLVQLLQQTDTDVQVQAASGQHWVSQADVTTDCWDKIWPDFIDLAELSPKTLQEEEQHLKDLAVYRHGDLLTDSQLQAGLREVSLRLSDGGQPAGLHVLLPAQLEASGRAQPDSQTLQPRGAGKNGRQADLSQTERLSAQRVSLQQVPAAADAPLQEGRPARQAATAGAGKLFQTERRLQLWRLG